MSQFGGVDEALPLAVERFERFHEVGESARFGRVIRLLVDRQDLLEFVLFLACADQHHLMATTIAAMNMMRTL